MIAVLRFPKIFLLLICLTLPASVSFGEFSRAEKQRAISDAVDRLFRVKKSAFKFVMIVEKV